MRMHNPAHPGEVLKKLYLDELGLTITKAAEKLAMPRAALSEIINCRRNVSPKTAIKFAKAFGGSAGRWLNMQAAYDLYQAELHYSADEVSRIEHTGSHT